MNKQGLIIILVLITTVFTGGVFFYFNKTKQGNIDDLTFIKKIDVLNWILVKNKKFNYEFKIPRDWSVKDGVDKQEGLLIIKDENNKEALTISTVQPMEEKLFKGLCYDLLYKEDTTKCEKAELGQLKYDAGIGYAYETTDYNTTISNERFIILANERLTFSVVDYSKNTNTIDNILNSIKVGEKRVAVQPIDAIKHRLDGEFKLETGNIDTSNWQSYQNKKYGFELKIPEEWECFEEGGVEKYQKFQERIKKELIESYKESIEKAEEGNLFELEFIEDTKKQLDELLNNPMRNNNVICLDKKNKQQHVDQNWRASGEPILKMGELGGYELVAVHTYENYPSSFSTSYTPLDMGIYKWQLDIYEKFNKNKKSDNPYFESTRKYILSDKNNLFVKDLIRDIINVELRNNSRYYIISILRGNSTSVNSLRNSILNHFKPLD